MRSDTQRYDQEQTYLKGIEVNEMRMWVCGVTRNDTIRHLKGIEVNEMRMWVCGVTRNDTIRSRHI